MPVVGMVGGGQLARMTQQAAIALGVRLRVLAENPADSAATVCADVRIGTHTSLEDLRAFAEGCDVVTWDHEHVPGEHIRALEAEGVVCLPGSAALLHAQDKLVMRERLSALGAPCPDFAAVHTVDDVTRFAEKHGWPVVVKAVRGGYDGKGVWIVRAPEEAAEVVASGTALMVEECVDFRRELAALVARSPHGQGAAYPVVETVQQDGICVEVVAPAEGLSEDTAAEAQRLALQIADQLGVVGLLAVELFETEDGVIVNELAMRPHNSGHWTTDGSPTSQFEQHLRAVLDLPLGDTGTHSPWTVMGNLLGGDDPDLYPRYEHCMAHDPGLKIHFYGKEVRPGRKIGHVNVMGDDLPRLRARAEHASLYLRDPGLVYPEEGK
ncbi:5-(carboxyamino)imidazole ribonucleotide synthase [Actinocorallia longicatena]|uniref:N5-carboxyaminoimidazole ribonucleotide synthase n=1 Tax=Actinocorallia longicatena TaxID=111803 RepID=A0ABP6QN96_9ACTN